jgi:hypothetical protein
MMFNATFNNISAISWRSVLLVEDIGVTGENPRPVEDAENSYPIRVYHMHRAMSGIRTHNVILGSSPDRVKPKTMKLAFVASPLNKHH